MGRSIASSNKKVIVMKQPELGQKILELRTQKGFTQEELVEQCNISVRTIQRIEAGEVTPRSFTVKTILEALDYDIEKFQYAETKAESEFKKLFLLKIDDSKHAGFLRKNLTMAWIAGIIYFVIGFIEAPIDWARYYENEMLFSIPVFIAIKVLILTSLILMLRGFVLCGNILSNYFLKITAFIMIVLNVFFYGYDVASIFMEETYFESVLIAQSITFGVVGILFGIAMLRLKSSIGTIATVTGIFEIITYALFALVVTALGGLIMLIPTIILEIILLYKVTSIVKEKEAQLSQA